MSFMIIFELTLKHEDMSNCVNNSNTIITCDSNVR